MSKSTTFTFKRTKGGRTHYVASVIPKTTVIDGFTDDPAKATKFSEADAKALLAVLESDKKVYGRWAVLDADGREVLVFTHATPTPPPPKTDPSVAASAKITRYADIPAGMVVTAEMAADRLLADEPDDSPFRELSALFDGSDPSTIDTGDMGLTLGRVAKAAISEITALRESLDALTAPADPLPPLDTTDPTK
jgi:hypothetical protein